MYRIGITVWGNRISPVFDSAGKILIAKVMDGRIINTVCEDCGFDNICLVLDLFEKKKVETLICGAVTIDESEKIKERGIRLVPFLTGNAAEVLEVCVKNEKQLLNYLMPGTLPRFELNSLKK